MWEIESSVKSSGAGPNGEGVGQDLGIGMTGSNTRNSGTPGQINWDLSTFLLCLGVGPASEERAWSPQRRRKAWLRDGLWTIFWTGICLAAMSLSHYFYHLFRYSGPLLTNGIAIGAMISLPWRFRVVFPVLFFFVIFVMNRWHIHFSYEEAAGMAAVQYFEVTSVSYTTLFFACLFSGTPGVRFDLTYVSHVGAAIIGLAWIFVCNALYVLVMISIEGVWDQADFGLLFMRWIDAGVVCAFAPFITSTMLYPPTLAWAREKPWWTASYAVMAVLCIAVPLLCVFYLPGWFDLEAHWSEL